jgi:hypothetical protein
MVLVWLASPRLNCSEVFKATLTQPLPFVVVAMVSAVSQWQVMVGHGLPHWQRNTVLHRPIHGVLFLYHLAHVVTVLCFVNTISSHPSVPFFHPSFQVFILLV